MDSVRIMSDMICSNPFVPDENERRTTVLAKFKEQIERFRVIPTKKKQAHSKSIVTVSGKVDKEGRISGSLQDDLMMAFCMNVDIWEKLVKREIATFPYSRVGL